MKNPFLIFPVAVLLGSCGTEQADEEFITIKVPVKHLEHLQRSDLSMNRSDLSMNLVRDTAATINSIETAAELFFMDNNRWPETVDELITKDDRGTSYLKGEPAPTDAWNNEFVFEVDGRELLIWSMGRDGARGGEGLDTDFNNRMIRR